MGIEDAYRAFADKHHFIRDDAQLRVVAALRDLQRRLQHERGWLRRLGSRLPWVSPADAPRGIYLWGGVGRGKTLLMDLFFTSLAVERKKRIHFHRMMNDIHQRLKALGDTRDPLDRIAADIAGEAAVLCFDEFFVSDIGDAMLLGRLLERLFERGVTLVATSNSPPTELYQDGLQRERFLPAIAALEKHTQVIELDGGVDYRLRLLQDAGTYLTPADDAAAAKLTHVFEEIAPGEIVDGRVLEVFGREIHTLRCAKGVAWFEFDEICGGPRSQKDYIEIARWYQTVIVSDVPAFTRRREDEARRFIALVDEFYDRKVKLILSAAAAVDSLYQGARLEFEFRRTASRLIEMQSRDYLHAAHLA